MAWSLRSATIACVLTIATAFLYLKGLSWSPAYFSIEEVGHALQVESLLATGRSLSGQSFPLWVAEPGYLAGREPLWIYATVGLRKILPFSETVVRLPSAITGVLDVLLMFVLARRLFRSDLVGAIGAVLLALMPAHYIHSRLATSQIGTVPFVIGWLIGLARYVDSGRRRDVGLATFCLALGTYAYLSATVMLPFFLLGTLAVIVIKRHDAWTSGQGTNALRDDILATFAGLLLALVPLVLWNVTHPDRFQRLLTYYTRNGYNTDLNGSVPWLPLVIKRLDIWWNCLNPEQVFFSGDGSPRYSTRQIGYALLPTVVFMATGFWALRRHAGRWVAVFIGLAILISPFPAVIAGDFDIKRWLSILPFAVLGMLAGVKLAIDSKRAIGLATVALVLVASGVQFARFHADYNGEYRSRYAFYFGGNLRGAIHNVLTKLPSDNRCVFLDGRSDVAPYWNLYTRASGRRDLAEEATLLQPEEFNLTVPAHCRDAAYIVLDNSLPSIPEANWTKTPIPEADGKVMIAVYRYATE